MLTKSLSKLAFLFSRSRARRGPIIDEQLKDLTQNQSFTRQIQESRQQFQSEMPSLTLSETLQQKKPKLKDRFQVDKKKLLKDMKKTIKGEIDINKIIQEEEGEKLDFTQYKSFIYDQKKQVEFEEKFRAELFKKKETNRLIEKEKNSPKNYLPQTKDMKYIRYEENKRHLKNSKIDSMMKFKRNNEDLRLLIESGYIDHPENLQRVIHQIHEKDKKALPETHSQNDSAPSQEKSMAELKTENENTTHMKLQEENQLVSQQGIDSESREMTQLHNDMMQNIKGPQQLRDKQKLAQFMEKYQERSRAQREQTKQNLDTLHAIKKYEHEKFLSRYEGLNFRFRGEVGFDWMKEQELLSYLKHQRGEKVHPESLLKIFKENENKLSRFQLPIITPTVMSRLYTVCSLYDFPENDQNNRLNMLNDPKYVRLEKAMFKNIDKVDDDSFADAVFAYARNHKEQQGVLRVAMSEKINQIVLTELRERMTSLNDSNLGIVLRSIMKMSILKPDIQTKSLSPVNWEQFAQELSQRLVQVEETYEFETAMSFLTLVPNCESTLPVLCENLKRFRQYEWGFRDTLVSFMDSASMILRFRSLLPSYQRNKQINEIKSIFCSKQQDLLSLVQKLSINKMPHLLSLICILDNFSPIEITQSQKQISGKLINKCKKEIVDNIRMQKEQISTKALGKISLSMALIDYNRQLTRNQSVATDGTGSSSLSPFKSSMAVSLQKGLFSFRAIPFNSINYFPYHETTKLMLSEIPNLSIRTIVEILFANSLVRYKNEGMFEQAIEKLIEKIHYDNSHLEIIEEPLSEDQISVKHLKEYMTIVCCFFHHRVTNQYYAYFIGQIQKVRGEMCKVQPQLLIRYFQAIVSLSYSENPKAEEYQIIKNSKDSFELVIEHVFNHKYRRLSEQNKHESKRQSTAEEAVSQQSEDQDTILSNLTFEEICVLYYVTCFFRRFQISLSQTVRKDKASTEIMKLRADNQRKRKTTISAFLEYLQRIVLQKQSQLSLEQKYLTNMSSALLIPSEFLQTDSKISQIEKEFHKVSVDATLNQEQQIGCKIAHPLVYRRYKNKLEEQDQVRIVERPWRIEIPEKKQVYIVATYEHLSARHIQDKTSVRLFGLSKVHEVVYNSMDWKVRIICTFLET